MSRFAKACKRCRKTADVLHYCGKFRSFMVHKLDLPLEVKRDLARPLPMLAKFGPEREVSR